MWHWLPVTAVSCNFLDLEPSDSVPYDDYYKTEDDLQYAINGVYRQIASNDVYGDAMQGRMGLCADLGYCSYANDLNTIAFNQNSTTDLLVLNYWRRLYNSIKRANLLLANIDGAEASVEFKDRIRGEALFLRAYAYFMLGEQVQQYSSLSSRLPMTAPRRVRLSSSLRPTRFMKGLSPTWRALPNLFRKLRRSRAADT